MWIGDDPALSCLTGIAWDGPGEQAPPGFGNQAVRQSGVNGLGGGQNDGVKDLWGAYGRR
jgi:hypothetical protein